MLFKVMSSFVAVFFISSAFADEKKDDTVKIMNAAIEHYKIKKEAAFTDFAVKEKDGGKFIKGEVYVYVIDKNGKCVAHAFTPGLVGKDLIDLKDPDGKLFIRELLKNTDSDPKGAWVDYKWAHPDTKKITPKTTFCVKTVGDVRLCSGYYK